MKIEYFLCPNLNLPATSILGFKMSTELCLGMIKELVQNLSFVTLEIVRNLEEN